MNVLRATSQATDDQMALLQQKAIDLGGDLTLPGTSASDAGDAMLELSKAGLSVNEILASSKGVLQMSAAGQLSNADAAQIGANALNAWRNAAGDAKLTGADMARVADLLAAAANASSADISDMGLALKMSASVAAMSGVPIQDLTTAIAQMANAGIVGSDAGTSLKTMLMRLQNPTKEAQTALDAMGISIYDAQGNMRPMRELVGQFSTALGGMTQEQRNAKLATIFGADAIRAANLVLASGTENWDQMSAAVNRQGAAADLSKAQMTGLGGAVQGLRSNIETALLQLALPALPWITNLVTQVSNMVPGVLGWLGQMGTGIGTLLGENQPGLDLLVQTFGSFLVGAFNTFGPIALALFNGLSLVIQMASASMR
jgi:TP901 family phage tail tape measure protein